MDMQEGGASEASGAHPVDMDGGVSKVSRARPLGMEGRASEASGAHPAERTWRAERAKQAEPTSRCGGQSEQSERSPPSMAGAVLLVDLFKFLQKNTMHCNPHTVPGPSPCGSAVGRLWGHLDRFPLRRLVVAEERPGTLGGGLGVVAVRGEAAPTPQAHRSLPAPLQPRPLPEAKCGKNALCQKRLFSLVKTTFSRLEAK